MAGPTTREKVTVAVDAGALNCNGAVWSWLERWALVLAGEWAYDGWWSDAVTSRVRLSYTGAGDADAAVVGMLARSDRGEFNGNGMRAPDTTVTVRTAPLWNDERARSWIARCLPVIGPGCAFDAWWSDDAASYVRFRVHDAYASAAELRARIQGLVDRGEFGPLGIS